MNNRIGILHLEDSIRDSELIHSMIESAEIEHEYFLAENEKAFLNFLETENIDIILSDYSLPDYNGNEALKVVREKYFHLPFLFISGAMGEDRAIDAMLNGATDYVLKNKLERLVPAIKRAIYEHEVEIKRELAEKALQESEKMLYEAQKLAHIGIWSWKADIDRVTWTKELYQIAGLDPNLPAPSYAEHPTINTPQSWYLLNTAVEKAMKTGESFQLELELIRPDGSIRNVNAFGGAKYNNNGQINGLYGTVQDITERKRAEQEIIRLNRIYAVFSNINHTIIRIKDKDELFKRVCQIVVDDGKFVLSWIGKIDTATNKVVIMASAGNNDDYLDKLNIDLSEEKLRNGPTGRAIESSNHVISTDIEHDESMLPWRENASKHGFKSSIALALKVFGNIYGTFNLYSNEVDFFNNYEVNLLDELAMDISFALEFIDSEAERKQTEQKLIIVNKELLFQNEEKEKRAAELIIAKEKAEESDRLKSAFLANMSHELRTPLNSIIGFSELMIDPDYEPAQLLKFAQIINASGTYLLAIINDIMDISKIEARQIHVNKRLLSVNQLIVEIHNEFSFKAIEKGIALKLDTSNPKDEIMIDSDATKLRQILVNLVSNAIKFTKEGFIGIGFKKVGDFVQFHISDSGIGISKEFHEQIFERFRQVESALSRKYGGNGLGLAISKSLVELLGGAIWLESEIGKGSTFYFLIPISEKQDLGTAEFAGIQKSSSLFNK